MRPSSRYVGTVPGAQLQPVRAGRRVSKRSNEKYTVKNTKKDTQKKRKQDSRLIGKRARGRKRRVLRLFSSKVGWRGMVGRNH